METITVESIPIVVGREEDSRWWADIEAMPGVMAYGDTREAAIAAVRALALRVAADCIEQGEGIVKQVAAEQFRVTTRISLSIESMLVNDDLESLD
jgi:predicted RNase H-like HicB family nuclease